MSECFSPAQQVNFDAHKAGPRCANSRPHGNEGVTSMQDQRTCKRCAKCGQIKPPAGFARDRSRPDGLTYWCRDCRNERARANHRSTATGMPSGPLPLPARDGDVRQARRRVNLHVERGRWPHPNALPCADCDHRWGPGERRHEYDHHLGYAAEHHEDVQAVCTTCHHMRENARSAAA